MSPRPLPRWTSALAVAFCSLMLPPATALATPADALSPFRNPCADAGRAVWGDNSTGWEVRFTNAAPRPLYLWAGWFSNIDSIDGRRPNIFDDGTRVEAGATRLLKGKTGPEDIDFRVTEHVRGLTPGPAIDIDVRGQCDNFFGPDKVRLDCRPLTADYKCSISQGTPGSATPRQQPIDVTISQA